MRVGIDKRLITPEPGICLVGFEVTERKVVNVHDDLYVTTMVLQQGSKKAVIICADVLGLGEILVSDIKSDINKRFGFSEDEILLSYSHTHSGPMLHENISPVMGEINSEYLKFFLECILCSVASSLSNMEDVDIYTGRTVCDIGINRRRIVDGKSQFAPNEWGAIDKEVLVAKFVKDDIVKAVVYNYACHPSILNSTWVTADYPGKAREIIEDSCGNDVKVFFLQGCCGNIRARTMEGGEFRRGSMDDIEKFGEILGQAVADVCKGKMKKMRPDLYTSITKVILPLNEIRSKNEYEDLLLDERFRVRVWAEKVLAGYNNLSNQIPYSIQKFSVGEGFHIIGMEGEVSIEYGIRIKQALINDFVMTAGYCNWVMGYIPTKKMLGEGGYEPEDSIYYYMLPCQFHESVEEIINDALDTIFESIEEKCSEVTQKK
jgi:Neutral/alkaline non-lysosomal ceramidase.